MRVSIIDYKKAVWEGNSKEVTLPARDGEMCVLDFHQAFVVRLGRGKIVFSNQRIPIKDGIAFMRSNTLNVFIQS